jgi:hypothetical protein
MKLQPLTMEGKARIVRMHKAGCLGAQSGQKLGIACQSFSNVVKQFLLLRLLSLQSLHVDILSSTIARLDDYETLHFHAIKIYLRILATTIVLEPRFIFSWMHTKYKN